jgi:hypothetical protein
MAERIFLLFGNANHPVKNSLNFRHLSKGWEFSFPVVIFCF